MSSGKLLKSHGSFWMQILATQTKVKIATLHETDYLTLETLNKCRSTNNFFWQETFKSYIKVHENFLAEYPNHRLLQLINGNNQLTLDGRSANIPCMHRKTLATTVNPDFYTKYNSVYENSREYHVVKKPKICT